MEKGEIRNELAFLSLIVILPYVGRSLIDYFLQSLSKFACRICFDERNPISEAFCPQVDETLLDTVEHEKSGRWILKIDDNDANGIKEAKEEVNSILGHYECGKIPMDLLDIWSITVDGFPDIPCFPIGGSHGSLEDPISQMPFIYFRFIYGWNANTLYAVAFLRLLFFHLLQPIAYIFVLWLYSDVISSLQLIFGCGVAVRECIYLLATIIALYVQPSFLLVNISAGWKTKSIPLHARLLFILLYCTMPDKFVLSIALKILFSDRSDCCVLALFLNLSSLMWFLMSVMDLFGIAALLVAVTVDRVFIPLVIGYCMTALSGVLIFPLGLWNLYLYDFLGCIFGCIFGSVKKDSKGINEPLIIDKTQAVENAMGMQRKQDCLDKTFLSTVKSHGYSPEQIDRTLEAYTLEDIRIYSYDVDLFCAIIESHVGPPIQGKDKECMDHQQLPIHKDFN